MHTRRNNFLTISSIPELHQDMVASNLHFGYQMFKELIDVWHRYS